MAGNLTAMIASIFSGGVTPDPYYPYTTLLLPGNGTNGAQNNTFLDGSTNNFTITRNGNTTQGTFSPFSQTGWGVFANATTTGYVTYPNSTPLDLSGGAFTIEGWIYPEGSYSNTGSLVGYNTIIAKRVVGSGGAGSANSSWEVSLNTSTGTLLFYNGTIYNSSTTPPANKWSHFACTYDGTNINLYLNGSRVLGPTAVTITNYTASTYVGSYDAGGTSFEQFRGYISNIRVTKGAALYSGASYDVPTKPLTTTVSSGTVSLLTHQSNRFFDNSTNNAVPTIVGSPSIQPFSPFNPTASWSAATYGGSGYFDGNGDFLRITSGYSLGSGAFTIEMFVYLTSVPNAQNALYSHGTADGVTRCIVYVGSDQKLSFYNNFIIATSTSTVPLNSWAHVAVVRNSGTVTLYINGSSSGTGTTSNDISDTTVSVMQGFGGISSSPIGYVSNLRVIPGTAVYTGNFTPPSLAPLTTAGSTSAASYPSTTNVNTSFASSATSLLLNFTNAGIYDATSKNDLETLDNTVNGVRISTTQSKFGGSSIYFDGTGTDYLWIQADQPIQRFGTAPFTIEMWIRLAALGSARGLVAKGTSTTGWLVSLNTSNQVVFTYGTSTITSTGTISQDVWTYIAVVREGTSTNQTKIYIGGVNDGTGTVSTDFTQTSSMYIGANRTGGDLYSGYIQDVRITNGYARTVTTVPTSAFPTL